LLQTKPLQEPQEPPQPSSPQTLPAQLIEHGGGTSSFSGPGSASSSFSDGEAWQLDIVVDKRATKPFQLVFVNLTLTILAVLALFQQELPLHFL